MAWQWAGSSHAEPAPSRFEDNAIPTPFEISNMRQGISFRNQQGQAMTEFALVLPMLALLLFAVIQFGIVFNNFITLTDSTRAGARKAAVSRRDPDPRATCIAAIRNSANNLNQSDLQPDCQSTWQPGADVRVTATYPYSISLLGIIRKSGRLTSTTTERVE
jgi:Flp pilus assembly protein TadG